MFLYPPLNKKNYIKNLIKNVSEGRGILSQTKNCRQFRLLTWTSFIGQLTGGEQVKGRGLGLSLFKPARRYTLLKNMMIWCKFQVIVKPLLSLVTICIYQVSTLSTIVATNHIWLSNIDTPKSEKSCIALFCRQFSQILKEKA